MDSQTFLLYLPVILRVLLWQIFFTFNCDYLSAKCESDGRMHSDGISNWKNVVMEYQIGLNVLLFLFFIFQLCNVCLLRKNH